jgi:hypothetical protein
MLRYGVTARRPNASHTGGHDHAIPEQLPEIKVVGSLTSLSRAQSARLACCKTQPWRLRSP